MKEALINTLAITALITLVSFCQPSQADSLDAEVGAGVTQNGKWLGLSYKYDLPKISKLPDVFYLDATGATISDHNYFVGRYLWTGGVGLGAHVESSHGYFARGSVGPAFISSTTDRLGSNFQFMTKIGIGIADVKGATFGVYWNHLSNGGALSGVNKGENYVAFGVGVEF